MIRKGRKKKKKEIKKGQNQYKTASKKVEINLAIPITTLNIIDLFIPINAQKL